MKKLFHRKGLPFAPLIYNIYPLYNIYNLYLFPGGYFANLTRLRVKHHPHLNHL